MDLMAITPVGIVEPSVNASLRWLANQRDGQWLLFFDNADDVHLTLKQYFPPCAYGNILVTTRNRELRHYAAAKGSDQNVTGMDHEDAALLLLHLSQVEETDENKVHAAQIVQVFLSFFVSELLLNYDTGTSLLRIGSLPSWRLHSLPLITKQLSRSLPT
jgi:hypothetical protein